MLTCDECNAEITADEFENYDAACEACARKEWERVKRWRAGGLDPIFDEIFTAIVGKPVVH